MSRRFISRPLREGEVPPVPSILCRPLEVQRPGVSSRLLSPDENAGSRWNATLPRGWHAVSWKLAILSLGLLARGATTPSSQRFQTVRPDMVVSNTLAHSHQLQILNSAVHIAGAEQSAARAAGLPHLSTDARAAWYTGLEDSQFGPLFTIPAINNRYGVGVTLSQPAWTGGRLSGQRQSAAHRKLASEQDRRAGRADVVLQALTSYWQWSKAFYATKTFQAAVARMAAHDHDMRNLRRAGLATENDELATDVALDQTRLQLEQAQRAVAVARARIIYLTGQPLATNSAPIRAQIADLRPPAPEAQLISEALSRRAERHARQEETRAAQAAIKASRGNYFPQVSLVARYEDARPNMMNIPPEDRWSDDAYAGVSVSWDVFDWGLTKAKVAQAHARADQAQAQLDQTEEQIVFEVRRARIDLLNAQGRLTVARRAQQSAKLNLKSANSLWRGGLARHSDVLDAHAQLTQAQFDVVAAQADVELARAALDHAVGVLVPSAPRPR